MPSTRWVCVEAPGGPPTRGLGFLRRGPASSLTSEGLRLPASHLKEEGVHVPEGTRARARLGDFSSTCPPQTPLTSLTCLCVPSVSPSLTAQSGSFVLPLALTGEHRCPSRPRPRREAVALCHVAGLCGGHTGCHRAGGSRGRGRLMRSLRLRGQVTAWSRWSRDGGLDVGLPLTHPTPSPPAPPACPRHAHT